MKTIKFFASLGVIPGYFHNNIIDTVENNVFKANTDLNRITKIWQDCAKESLTKGLCTYHVSAMFMDSLTVYNMDFGCPYGGEKTVFITGDANPYFITDLDTYKKDVLYVLKQVSIKLKQSTTQISFSEVDYEYIKNEL
mgnify:CR=1 FL=1